MNELLASVKILVCEDNEDHRFLMLDALRESHPEAIYFEAESGDECIRIVNVEEPDVLILDYRLIDLDGLEILKAIHEKIGQIAVLLVTSQGDENVAVAAMKLGARDYLVKDTGLSFIKHLPISVSQAVKQISTEREKQAAVEKLRTSEEVNRTIINQMSEAIIYTDALGNILHLNNLAIQLFGLQLLNCTECNISDVRFSNIIPQISEQLALIKSDRVSGVVETESLVSNDKYYLCRTMPVVNSHTKIIGMIITIIDTTERKKNEIERLESIHQMVFALAKAVELRDPYTSGHAANVSWISTRIAVMLGWDQQRITGLKLAGELHDIGKIAIPAEILTRPTKLSLLEREMLKEHPEKGYDILKEIKFPFPIAQAVYQHHEVLDGTGYPRHLRDDEIIPEARILTVADVLDAITSHRPYRAGLGINKALEHLMSQKGILYDETVIDVVVQLIKESGNSSFWDNREGISQVIYHSLRDKNY